MVDWEFLMINICVQTDSVISGTPLAGKWCVVRSGVELKHQQAAEDGGASN